MNKHDTFISPNELIEIAKRVVARYMYKGAIPKRDAEDTQMSIVEKFYNQQIKIKASFKGDCKINTYCIAILNRMCCEIIRKDFKTWQQVQNNETPIELGRSETYTSEKKAVINSEIKRLKYILNFFGDDRYKLILCIKLIYNLFIDNNDIKNIGVTDVNKYMIILKEAENKLLADKYNVLASLFNEIEDKKNKGDSIRMWMNKNTDKIIYLLNENNSNYDKKSIVILFEYMFSNHV